VFTGAINDPKSHVKEARSNNPQAWELTRDNFDDMEIIVNEGKKRLLRAPDGDEILIIWK